MRTDIANSAAGFALIVLAELVPNAANAHHSIGGEFGSSRQVSVTGIVEEYALINPHTYIVVEVDADGRREEWTLTFGPATKLIRGSSWNAETVKPGDRLTATGRPDRKGLGMYLSELVRDDARVLIDELVE